MPLRLLADRVAVKPFDPETNLGSIVLPDLAAQSPLKGEVIAVGPGRVLTDGSNAPVEVAVGDVVYYGWGGAEVEYGGQKLLVFHESDILAVVESDG